MSMQDPLSDMLTRIRNACMVKHQTTKVPSTRMTKAIAQVLQSEGFIASFEETGEIPQKFIEISLKYKGRNRQPIIS